MSHLDAGRTKLVHSLKGLHEKWDVAQEHWRDQVRSEFEEKYLREITERARSTLSAMDRLAEMMERAQRECGG